MDEYEQSRESEKKEKLSDFSRFAIFGMIIGYLFLANAYRWHPDYFFGLVTIS